MTQFTPTYALPFPELTDAPNGPAQFQALALAVETVLTRMDTAVPIVRQYTALGVTAWAKPAAATGFKGVWVRVTGGGGGSGGVTDTAAGELSPAAGGGGAGTAEAWIPASALAASENVTVAAGGLAGTAGPNDGGAGGTSSFGGFVTAPGGSGGSGAGTGTSLSYSSPAGQGGGNGNGAFGGTASPIITFPGSDGTRGLRNSGTQGQSGFGGAAGFGGGLQTGGYGGTTSAAVPGAIPGGGAAGGMNQDAAGVNAPGAAGARGEVIVIEIYTGA